MPYTLNGKQLQPGRPFKTADGVSYSQLWATQLSAEEKTAIGINWLDDPEPFNSDFYTSPGTPRDIATLKPTFIQQQKDICSGLLVLTDWYVTRKAETDTAIPEAVTTRRAAIRAACAAREAEITAVTTTQELEALMRAPNKVMDKDGKLVDNSAAHLTPWPEA